MNSEVYKINKDTVFRQQYHGEWVCSECGGTFKKHQLMAK